ncbi:PAN domain-containing protein [Brevundimonas aveniformis]|uniref:PAN domain-containing protein n=1 Tax=Brevundimonas aveniformis TaxID=370977 RepID=UPI000412B302|nr:PAN domain-containing protein [Brevundimonas aveniformis]
MRVLTGLATVVALLGLVACGQSSGTETGTEGATAGGAAAGEASATPPPTTSTTAAGGGAPGELEVGFDRPGGDIDTLYEVVDAEACQAACVANEECQAFTWVQAGVQAEYPVCWLKDRAPPTIEAEWATSGVMVGRETPAEG